MDYKRLGFSGLSVSPLCLGSMMFGGRTDEKQSTKIIDHARDVGINFIDSADGYNKGKSEQVVGKAIKKTRDQWVLATKVYNPMGPGPNERGLGAKWIAQECEQSLKRLNTDYIDIYYFHKDDTETPLEESLAAAKRLIDAGKIRYYGISNYYGWRQTLLCATAENMGIPLPVAVQPYYNALTRDPEKDILPSSEHFGMGVVTYSPLSRGVLTAKYAPGEEPGKNTRAGSADKRLLETEWTTHNLRLAQKMKKHAERKGMTAAEWAVNWVLANPIVTSVLAGPRTYEQWTSYLRALDHRDKWSERDEVFWDKLVSPGHPATHGYNDPQYPVTGRPV